MIEASYTKLEVWNKAIDVVELVYTFTKSFPKEELYSLTSQIRRAAVSIPSNIAEGRARRSTREFMRFVDIASGSASELDTQIRIAERLHYLSSEQTQALLTQVTSISMMLNRLHSSLETKLAA